MLTNPKTYEIVIVLAHLMEKDGTLKDETRSRLEYAYQIYHAGEGEKMLLMGWDYRDDTGLCISDAMNRHLQRNFTIKPEDVLICRKSRDTVGDAVFSQRDFCSSVQREICVVTSDYHKDRTKIIFDFVYGTKQEIDVIGVDTGKTRVLEASEQKSLMAFHETFDGIMIGDHGSILKRLAEKHPYYNGTVYPKIET